MSHSPGKRERDERMVCVCLCGHSWSLGIFPLNSGNLATAVKNGQKEEHLHCSFLRWQCHLDHCTTYREVSEQT